MTTQLNARAAGLWRNADGLAVTVVSRDHRAVTVELSAAYGGYKAGAHVALPATWVTEDAVAVFPPGMAAADCAAASPSAMESFVFDYVNERKPDLVAAAIAAWEAKS